MLKQIRLEEENIPSKNSYPFTIPAISHFSSLDFQNKVTFFVGENGSGKSTLLEAIAYQCQFNTAGGGRNNRYEVHASQSDLGEYLQLSWSPTKLTNGFFLRAESFYQFATHIDQLDEFDSKKKFASYGGKSLLQQSHGESFLSLFLHRFRGEAIYLLDEPEAALSPQRQLSFLRILHDLAETEECQFIIATHSPILLGYPNATILSFDGDQIEEIAYEDTEHYQITKYFLQYREKMLKDIFTEEEM